MAINKNHEFEDIEGVKCAVVERSAPGQRVDFLRLLLTHNGYQVVVVATAPPKAIPAAALVAADQLAPAPQPVVPALPATFTVGVTDVMFNATNAIFGRTLRTTGGQVVTLAYWQQKEAVASEDTPYFDKQ